MRRQLRAVRFSLLLATAAVALPVLPAMADVKEDLAEGDKAFEEGKLARAARAYDRAIKSAPKQVTPEAYGKRAAIFFLLATQATNDGKPEQAKTLLEDGLTFVEKKAEPIYPGAPEILEQKALILWDLKRKPEAVKAAEEAVSKSSARYLAQRLVGEYYAVRDPDRSIKAYEAYLRHRPASAEGADVMPRIYLGFAYLSTVKRSGGDVRLDVKLAKLTTEKAMTQFETLLQKHRKARHAEVNANNGLCTTYAALAQIEELEGNRNTRMWDRAITACEKIIENPRTIDRGGSVYYNVGRAYLAKKQTRKARTVGQEYVRMRKDEPRGYILIGDSYALERNWNEAINQYREAERRAKQNQAYAATIGIKMGVAFRGANRPGEAIAKLEAARKLDSTNFEVIKELSYAYLANRDDTKALATVKQAIGAKDFATSHTPAEQAALHALAGKAAYNQAIAKKDGDLKEARASFEAAQKLAPRDTAIRTGLVKTMTAQAYQAYRRKDVKEAVDILQAALTIDKKNPAASQNMAAIAIDGGRCDEARGYLAALSGERGYTLTYHRLMGRVSLCGKNRDVKAAIEHYAAAEKAAGNANLIRAEIYTEWGPLLWDKDLDEAVDKLEAAVQFTAQNPRLGKPAQRALALALYRRGWRTLSGGKKAGDPVDDFQRASRDPSVLRGTEPQAFEFSEALARLDRGDAAGAAKLFDALGKKGNQSAYLKAPYDKIGAQFFGAYAKYRSGNAGQLRQACGEFASLSSGAKGNFGEKVRDLLASCHEQVAYDALESGNEKAAVGSLDTAARYASSAGVKRRINHNKVVVRMGSKPNKGLLDTFAGMGADPPEALVNKGILLDREGKACDAYNAWVQARAKGARGRYVQDWIATKKRLFGC